MARAITIRAFPELVVHALTVKHGFTANISAIGMVRWRNPCASGLHSHRGLCLAPQTLPPPNLKSVFDCSRLIGKRDCRFTGETLADVMAQPVYKNAVLSGSCVQQHNRGIITLGIEECTGAVPAGRAVVPVVSGFRFKEPRKCDARSGRDISFKFMRLDKRSG